MFQEESAAQLLHQSELEKSAQSEQAESLRPVQAAQVPAGVHHPAVAVEASATPQHKQANNSALPSQSLVKAAQNLAMYADCARECTIQFEGSL